MELRNKIVGIIYKHELASIRNENPSGLDTADEIISLIDADYLSRPVELWAEKECPACLGEGNIPMSDGYSSHPCTLCDNGLIRRQLTAGEAIEILKMLIKGTARQFFNENNDGGFHILLPTGERVR
jgi:hypothetical protein